MGRSTAAQICFTKDAADAHKFALHSADGKQQCTKDGLVLRLFMSRIVTDVQKGLRTPSCALSRERGGIPRIDDLVVGEPPDANQGIFVIQDNARAYPGMHTMLVLHVWRAV